MAELSLFSLFVCVICLCLSCVSLSLLNSSPSLLTTLILSQMKLSVEVAAPGSTEEDFQVENHGRRLLASVAKIGTWPNKGMMRPTNGIEVTPGLKPTTSHAPEHAHTYAVSSLPCLSQPSCDSFLSSGLSNASLKPSSNTAM